MATPSDWLKKVALAVDELLRGGTRVLDRFQRRIVECDEAEWRARKAPPGGTGSGVLPVKALKLREKYAWLAAIHDTVGERVKLISPYGRQKHFKRGRAVRSQSAWSRRMAGMVSAIRKNDVRLLTDADHPRVMLMLTEVCRDLGVPVPAACRSVPARAAVNINIVAAKKDKKRRKRVKRKGFTPQENKFLDSRGRGESVPETCAALEIGRSRYYELKKSAEERSPTTFKVTEQMRKVAIERRKQSRQTKSRQPQQSARTRSAKKADEKRHSR